MTHAYSWQRINRNQQAGRLKALSRLIFHFASALGRLYLWMNDADTRLYDNSRDFSPDRREVKTMLISRMRYYLSSIPTLLTGVRNWPVMFAAFLRLPIRKPFTIELRPSGVRFRVRTAMDVWIIKETCLDRDYETASVALQDGWIVLDIGAGLGDFAIDSAKRHPHSVVYAYEPFPESFALLQENVRLNSLQNVRMFPYAVGGVPSGRLTLYATGEAVQHHTAEARTTAAQTFEVTSVSLDQIFEGNHLTQCDFLKIDCEGAEYEILFNASEQILGRIRHVCLEYHEGLSAYTHQDLARFFRDKGFRVTVRPNPAHRHLGFLHAANIQISAES
jgi:FkbM family methyltransferase